MTDAEFGKKFRKLLRRREKLQAQFELLHEEQKAIAEGFGSLYEGTDEIYAVNKNLYRIEYRNGMGFVEELGTLTKEVK